MPKNLEERFREEVRQRRQQKRSPGPKVGVLLLVICIVSGVAYLIYRVIFSPPLDSPAEDTANPTNQPTPIALPPSGVLEQDSSINNKKLGKFRFFLRAPLASEKSTLPATCAAEKVAGSMKNNNHYFVELLNWKSDKVVSTASIRSGDMVEMSVPLDSYKLRYTLGTEWYGQTMFGSEDMYEMTEKSFLKTAKFELTQEKSGYDIGAYCTNGNLGRKRINKGERK